MYRENCVNCCIFRRNMIAEMNTYFTNNNFDTKKMTEVKDMLEQDYDVEISSFFKSKIN